MDYVKKNGKRLYWAKIRLDLIVGISKDKNCHKNLDSKLLPKMYLIVIKFVFQFYSRNFLFSSSPILVTNKSFFFKSQILFQRKSSWRSG